MNVFTSVEIACALKIIKDITQEREMLFTTRNTALTLCASGSVSHDGLKRHMDLNQNIPVTLTARRF